MPEYMGHKPGAFENVAFAILIAALCLMFVVMSQPAWRGGEMIAELKSNCAKQGGVILENKGMFGTSYKCAERLDR